MIGHAFLEEGGSGRLRHEEDLLCKWLSKVGVPFTLYTKKRIQRRQLNLTRESFVAGDLDCVIGAMKQLEIDVPTPNDYPRSLRAHLHRQTWESTLEKARLRSYDGFERSIFVKPVSRAKRFTGFIIDSYHDLYKASGVSGRERIACSEVVTWLSEYRVYVCNDRILSIDNYSGDKSVEPDMEVVDEAIRLLRLGGEATAGYSLDYGVLDNGKTALVEFNDGFSLGAYQISPEHYTTLLMTRWQELLNSKFEGSATHVY